MWAQARCSLIKLCLPCLLRRPPPSAPLCSQEKLELPDGRHRIEWYLMDERNDAHLAIVGAFARMCCLWSSAVFGSTLDSVLYCTALLLLE